MSVNQDDPEALEKQRIMQEIYQEVSKIEALGMAIQNNLMINSLDDLNDPSVEHISNCESLRIVLKEEQGRCSAALSDNVEKDILEQLEMEKKCLELDITRIGKLVPTNKENIMRLTNNMENLKMMEERSHNQQDKNLKLDVIAQNLKIRFRAEKRDLKTVIDSLFPDNIELHDIIATVIDHYFKEGPDKWLTLEYKDGISEMIETLSQSMLIEVNPRDYLQIKLANLL